MEEIFKDFEYDGMRYKVSNYGRIFGVRKELKQRLNEDGYWEVTIGSEKRHRTSFRVHRLVALLFVYNDNPSLKTEVNHKDFDRQNSNADNLEWVSHKDNVKYSYEAGHYKGRYEGIKNPKASITDEEVKNIRRDFEYGKTINDIVFDLYGLTRYNNLKEYKNKHGKISDIVKYRTWVHI